MTPRSALLLVCVLAGCARSPAGLTPLPYGAATAPAADSVRYSPAVFLMLPLLDRTTLPAGTRELRLWTPPGLIAPRWLTRVVESPVGASVQRVAYWPDRPQPPSGERYRESFERRMRRDMGCRRIEQREGTKFCVGRAVTGPRARALVARLDSLGAWNPPAPRGLPPRQRRETDGAALWVEARVGSEYRAVLYQAEDFTPGGIAPALGALIRPVR